MTIAKLLNLTEDIPDSEIMRALAQKGEFRIGGTIIRRTDVSEKGVSGDFGEPITE